MIIGKIHPGSGLGDQLFSYIVTRVIALDKGYEFGFVGKEFFKGKDFMTLDWGKEIVASTAVLQPEGKLFIPTEEHRVFEINKPYYDPEVNFIEDGTIIDGYGAQDLRYFEHRFNEIKEWLKVKPIDIPENVCVINFRGGEYATVPELFLPKEYWDKAIQAIRNKYLDRWNDFKFVVHTDDPILAKQFFPDFEIIRDIEQNWKAIRYAKHLIISNSAFAIIPSLLNENVQEVIAPRYWNRYNLKRWDWPMNHYKQFKHI